MKRSSVVKLIAAMLLIVAVGYCGYKFYQIRTGSQHAESVLETMKSVIPNLGVDTGVSTGRGRDPLPELVIDDKSIVGCIEIPAIDVMAPVTAPDYEESGFATAIGGSPVKGNFQVAGSHDDIFTDLSKLKPGDTAAFTDIDGVRYNYRVTTQFHLKDWDEADQDLMLCFRTDNDTMFVVGCTEAN